MLLGLSAMPPTSQETPGRVDWNVVAARMRPFVMHRVRSDADADDILQELFLRVDRGLPNLRDTDRVGPWLFQIVRNLITDHYRAASRMQAAPTEVLDARAAEQDESREAVRALAACVEPFVKQLPSPYREAITMVELEGLTHKRAAEQAGVTEPGMKSRVQRGRVKLRALLEGCCQIERDTRNRIAGYERWPDGQGCDDDC